LIDQKVFTTSAGSVPYAIPTIVKAEADHMIVSAGSGGTNVVHAIACAQPACVHDPRPAPGAFTLSQLSGSMPEIANLNLMINDSQVKVISLDIKTSTGGDTPGGGSLVLTTTPPYGGSMPLSQALSTGMYDWLRRAGTKANIGAVKNLMTTPFKPGITATVGGVNVYTWNEDGTIRYVQVPNITTRTVVVSHLQGFGQGATLFNSSNGSQYQITATDESRQPGRMRGGQHGGEPLVDSVVQTAAGMPGTNIVATSDFGSDIAGLSALLLMILVPSGLFVYGTQRQSKLMRQLAAFGLLAASCASMLGLLTACGGGSPPPPVVVTTTVTGGRVPRATYTSNGIVIDVSFKKI